MTSDPRPQSPSPDPSSEDSVVAARRRAILHGLGQGGAALAALSPLASHAARSHNLPNSELKSPGLGYCSVSGFQSAAISGAPDIKQCTALEPKDFAAAEVELVYETLISQNASTVSPPFRNQLAEALKARYGSETGLTGAIVGNTLRANPPSKLVIDSGITKVVILPAVTQARRSGRELKPTALFPATSVNPTAKFNSIFPSSIDDRTLLEVLQDGVNNSTPASANCFVLAAYLSVGASTADLPSTLDREYIRRQYTESSYGSGTNLYRFFKALCLG